MLAPGDIKAAWAQCFGAPSMKNILKHIGQEWMLEPRAHGSEFSAYHASLWRALREEYLAGVDPKAHKGELILDSEYLTAYIAWQMKIKWKTEEEVDKSLVLQTLFKRAGVEAMSAPFQRKLEKGLTSISIQFCDHVVHSVEKHRKDEKKLMYYDKTMRENWHSCSLENCREKPKQNLRL